MATVDVNAEKSIIDDLRCFICNQYLVYGPVQATPDGNTMCGHCSSGNTDAHRVFVLEKILRKLSFPCKNKKYGCSAKCHFDMAENHESKCSFQAFPCPFVQQWNCLWKGIVNNFNSHLNTCHKDLIRKDLKFSFDVNYNKEEQFVALSKGKLYFVHYTYDNQTFDLRYSCAQFANKVELNSKIEISNDTDGERTMILKGGTCVGYTTLSTKDEFVLNMQPFMALLLDSKLLFCTLIVETKEQPKPVATTSEAQESEKVEATDKKEKKEDEKADNKCKWRGCKSTLDPKNKKAHEKTCKFRVYKCIKQGCNKFFKSDGGELHFQTHNIMFCQKFSTINFLTPNGEEYSICSYVNKEFVLISFTMFNCKGPKFRNNPLILIKANSSGYKGGVAITFSHTHCKIQSKSFYVKWNNALTVLPDELPPCFYTEQFISFSLIVNAD